VPNVTQYQVQATADPTFSTGVSAVPGVPHAFGACANVSSCAQLSLIIPPWATSGSTFYRQAWRNDQASLHTSLKPIGCPWSYLVCKIKGWWVPIWQPLTGSSFQ
jgi:hypothetical protein